MNKKILSKVIIFLMFLTGLLTAQTLKDIKIYSDYSSGIDKRFLVWKAAGVGGGADINFELYEGLTLGISAGYQLFTINQDSVIQQLQWDFWEYRYKGNISVDLTDTTIKATLSPFEKMDVMPIKLNLEYNYSPVADLTITPSLGGGIIFYTRRIYIEETWSKYYPTVGYTFIYSYRNFAPFKSGNPLFISSGLNASYKLTELFSIYGGFNYNHIIATDGDFGYDIFPFKNYYSVKLGLTFMY